jgi:hypothetical protein
MVPATDEQVIQFLSLFHNDPKEKIFVHCRFGDDRTGVFVATYRMALEKWPAEQALNEMYFFGFNGFWHPSMKTFINEFRAHLDSTPAFRLHPHSGFAALIHYRSHSPRNSPIDTGSGKRIIGN